MLAEYSGPNALVAHWYSLGLPYPDLPEPLRAEFDSYVCNNCNEGGELMLGVGMCPYFGRNTLNDPHMTTLFGKSHAALVSAFGSFVVVNTRLRCWQSKGGRGAER